jgi:hypothetical protein
LQTDCFKLNSTGCLNKTGENRIYLENLEIVKFGVGRISDHVIFLSGGFISLYPGKGHGKASIHFLFKKLPCIQALSLQCKDNVLQFWIKSGGNVVERVGDYNIVKIYRSNLVI